MFKVLHEGLMEPKEFDGLLEALEYVAEKKQQDSFLLKMSDDSPWEDGAKTFRGFQSMFSSR
jgi:hypothetical protein